MRQKFDHIDLMEDGEEQRQAFTQLFGQSGALCLAAFRSPSPDTLL